MNQLMTLSSISRRREATSWQSRVSRRIEEVFLMSRMPFTTSRGSASTTAPFSCALASAERGRLSIRAISPK